VSAHVVFRFFQISSSLLQSLHIFTQPTPEIFEKRGVA